MQYYEILGVSDLEEMMKMLLLLKPQHMDYQGKEVYTLEAKAILTLDFNKSEIITRLFPSDSTIKSKAELAN